MLWIVLWNKCRKIKKKASRDYSHDGQVIASKPRTQPNPPCISLLPLAPIFCFAWELLKSLTPSCFSWVLKAVTHVGNTHSPWRTRTQFLINKLFAFNTDAGYYSGIVRKGPLWKGLKHWLGLRPMRLIYSVARIASIVAQTSVRRGNPSSWHHGIRTWEFWSGVYRKPFQERWAGGCASSCLHSITRALHFDIHRKWGCFFF